MKRGPAYNMRSKDGGGLFVFQLNGHHGRWVFARMAGLAVEVLQAMTVHAGKGSAPHIQSSYGHKREGWSLCCCYEYLDCGFLFILISAECLMSQIIFTRLPESYSSLELFCAFSKPQHTCGIKIAGGERQPTFWLQYTLVGAEPDPMACSRSDKHEWNVVQHRSAGALLRAIY